MLHPYNDSTQVGESDIDEFGRDMSVLALVDVAAGSRVVHVKTDKVHTLHEPFFRYNVRALISTQLQTRAPQSIGLREGSTFPGVRNGSDIMSGSIMPFTKRVELASAVEGGEVVCMYEMTNGRGWLHDYDPNMPNKKGALPFVVVRAVVPPNTKLGVMFEEPELKFGGGHMVLQLQPDSVLATGGVHEKDLLVLVDRHCVAGLLQVSAFCTFTTSFSLTFCGLQEELVAFVQSRAAEQKTLVFLRQVKRGDDTVV